MKKLLFIALLTFSQLALAEWTLDNDNSQLNFDSTKNNTITETHTFQALSGTVADNGKANLIIVLTSVDTKVPLRDERMRTMLFETEEYPRAEFITQVNKPHIEKLAVGDSTLQTLKGELQLHGTKKPITAEVKITRLADNKVEIATVKPIIVNANDFKLHQGVENLREIMGLNSITPEVPVSFRLVFVE